MQKVNRCSLRIQKVKSNKIEAADGHNRRTSKFEVRVVDSTKTINNKSLIQMPCTTLRESIDYLVNECSAKTRKNNCELVEWVLTATPDYFRPDTPNAIGVYDEKRLDDWVQATMKWMQEKYGKNIIQAELHLDEATPHIHVMIVPIVTKEHKKRRTKAQIDAKEPAKTYTASSLDADTLLKTKNYYNAQTEYGSAVEHLGIKRGIKHSRATHQTLKKFYAALDDPSVKIPAGLTNHPDIPLPTKNESQSGFVKRVTSGITGWYDKRFQYLVDTIKKLDLKANYWHMMYNNEVERTALYSRFFDAPDGVADALIKLDEQAALIKRLAAENTALLAKINADNLNIFSPEINKKSKESSPVGGVGKAINNGQTHKYDANTL